MGWCGRFVQTFLQKQVSLISPLIDSCSGPQFSIMYNSNTELQHHRLVIVLEHIVLDNEPKQHNEPKQIFEIELDGRALYSSPSTLRLIHPKFWCHRPPCHLTGITDIRGVHLCSFLLGTFQSGFARLWKLLELTSLCAVLHPSLNDKDCNFQQLSLQ